MFSLFYVNFFIFLIDFILFNFQSFNFLGTRLTRSKRSHFVFILISIIFIFISDFIYIKLILYILFFMLSLFCVHLFLMDFFVAYIF